MKRTFEDIRKQLVGQRQERKFVATRADMKLDGDNRTVEISFSSEAPVERWFGFEILDHTPAAVDLVRLNTAGPLLNNHNTDRKLGWVMPGTARIDTDRKGRCTVRLSRRQIAEDEWQDIQDGAPVTVSVGYFIHELVLEKKSDEEMDTYRATKWEPLEVTFAPVPADITVGGGRALDDDDERQQQDAREQREEACAECAGAGCDLCAQAEGDRAAAQDKQPVPAPARATQTPTEVRTLKMDELMQQFEREGVFFGEAEMAREFYAEGKKIEDFRASVLEKKRAAQKPPQHGKPLVDLNDREKQTYSISRAILMHADRTMGQNVNSFELEVSEEIRKQIGSDVKLRNGVLVPTGVGLRGMQMQRTPLTAGGSGTGAETVFTEPGSFIDLLRNRAMVMELGATVLPGLRGPVSFPRQTGAGTLYWTGENAGSDVTESNTTLDQVTLSPKTAMAREAYSRQLLAQGIVAADQIVTNDLVRIGALGIDRAAIHGSGASNQPTGLYGLSGVNSVAFGGAVSFAKSVQMETEIATDNADISTMAYLTTPGVRGNGKTTQQFSGTNGVPLWTMQNGRGEVNGYRAEATNQVSSVMNGSAATGGSSHGIIFGAWDQLLVGEWGAVELVTDPFTLAAQALIRVILFLMVDINARHGENFCKGTGLTVS